MYKHTHLKKKYNLLFKDIKSDILIVFSVVCNFYLFYFSALLVAIGVTGAFSFPDYLYYLLLLLIPFWIVFDLIMIKKKYRKFGNCKMIIMYILLFFIPIIVGTIHMIFDEGIGLVA